MPRYVWVVAPLIGFPTAKCPCGCLSRCAGGSLSRAALSPPVNDHLVELLILAETCRRAAARCRTAVIPYLGYSRADKRHGCCEAISSSMVADLLQAVGISHVITMDLHAPQIEGFFHVPVDER